LAEPLRSDLLRV